MFLENQNNSLKLSRIHGTEKSEAKEQHILVLIWYDAINEFCRLGANARLYCSF